MPLVDVLNLFKLGSSTLVASGYRLQRLLSFPFTGPLDLPPLSSRHIPNGTSLVLSTISFTATLFLLPLRFLTLCKGRGPGGGSWPESVSAFPF